MMCQTNKIQLNKIESTTEINAQEKYPNGKNYRKNGFHMEDALSKTKFGKFNYSLILIAGTILGAVSLEQCSLGLVLPVSQIDLQLSRQEQGVLGGVTFIGIILSSNLWGYLADTIGRKRIIQPTLMIAFILSIASTFTNNFYLFAVLRMLNGFFISGSAASIYAYLGEFHSIICRSRAIMGSALIYSIFCLLMPVLALLIINQEWKFFMPFLDITYRPWRLFLIACSLPGFLASIVLFFYPESPTFVLGQGKRSETIEILKQIDRWKIGCNSKFEIEEIFEETESIENRKRILESSKSRFPMLKSIWTQTIPLFRVPYLGSTLWLCFIQFGIYATSNGFYMFFADISNRMVTSLNSFFHDRVDMCDVIRTTVSNDFATKLEVNTLEQCIILEALNVSGFVLINLFINKVGKFHILAIILGFSSAGGFICMLSNIPIIQIASFIALMCSGIADNVISAAAIDIYATANRATAICVALMVGQLGGVVGSNVAAYLLQHSCELTFYLAAGCSISCLVLASLLPNIHDKPTKKHRETRISVISTCVEYQ